MSAHSIHYKQNKIIGQKIMRSPKNIGETKSGSESSSKPTGETPGGDGIRSLKTSGVFRAVNFELYAKPVNLALKILHVYKY